MQFFLIINVRDVHVLGNQSGIGGATGAAITGSIIGESSTR